MEPFVLLLVILSLSALIFYIFGVLVFYDEPLMRAPGGLAPGHARPAAEVLVVRAVEVRGGSEDASAVEAPVEVVDRGGDEESPGEKEMDVVAEDEKDAVLEEERTEREEEDWEGVERSELEEAFARAMAFASSDDGTSAVERLGGDVQMRLYGLQKIAMEGPCYKSHPMALKVAALLRWHAWRKLGSMDQEAAMEQYITLLSNEIPGWMDGKPRVKVGSAEESASSNTSTDKLVTSHSLSGHHMLMMEIERKTDLR